MRTDTAWPFTALSSLTAAQVRLLQQRPLGNHPAIVPDEAIPDGGGGDGGSQQTGGEGGLPRRYSHSIVAGGLELTS